MTRSAIFFTYGSQRDLDYIISGSEVWPFDEILIAMGGDIMLPDRLKGKNDGRVKIFHEERRLGKTASYNRIIREVRGEEVFIISGDVRFNPETPSKLLKMADSNVGLIIPRVVPVQGKSLAQKVGAVIWSTHEIFNSLRDNAGTFFCGGEFQLIIGTPPAIPEGIINDDEYIGSQIFSSGKRIVYCREAIVSNETPGSFIRLLQQRVRVNYGHLQCLKLFGSTSSFSLESARNIRESFSIIRKIIDGKPGKIFLLFLAVYVEFTSILLSRLDFQLKVDMRKWKIVNPDVRTSK